MNKMSKGVFYKLYNVYVRQLIFQYWTHCSLKIEVQGLNNRQTPNQMTSGKRIFYT